MKFKFLTLKSIVTMIIIILIMTLSCLIFSYPYVDMNKNTNSELQAVTSDSETNELDNKRILLDFANNEYILVEKDNYYSITHAYTGLLIEENDGNGMSPYINYDKIWYCGPLNYFYEINNRFYSVVNNEELVLTNEIIDYCNNFNNFMINEYIKQNKNRISTYSNGDKIDYYELKYPSFFTNLDTSSRNTNNSCGYVAASSLLAYYDYCYGENSFIKSNYWLYKTDSYFRYSSYLCDTLKSFGKPNNKNEWPSNADTIKAVMKKYFDSRNQTNVKHYSWAGIFTTNLMLCDSIRQNNPVILFTWIYDPSGETSGPINHAVVVHKAGVSYINGSTIYTYWMHYGWGTNYNNVRLTNNVTNFTVHSSYYLNIK